MAENSSIWALRATITAKCWGRCSPQAAAKGSPGRQVSELADAVESFAGSTLCTVSSAGKALPEVAFEGRLGWIFGAEGQGVTHTLAARARERVRIPMQPGNESLNVAAAAAICLYEAFTRKK